MTWDFETDPAFQEQLDWIDNFGRTEELGGEGHGQIKRALMNESLGRSSFAPTVFGCRTPDTGNAEIPADYPPKRREAAREKYGDLPESLDDAV